MALMILVSHTDGATVDQDYIYVYKEISISPGEMACVDVPILNDTLYEGHETFEVVMSAVSGTLSNFTSSSTVVTILEDDACEWQISSAIQICSVTLATRCHLILNCIVFPHGIAHLH